MAAEDGPVRRDNGGGGTTTRHDSGKGQQGDRMHDDFDGRMMTTRGSRATGRMTTATSGPDDLTIN